jgi:hypothetical protein
VLILAELKNVLYKHFYSNIFEFMKVVVKENVWRRVLIFSESQRNSNFSKYLRNEMSCARLAYVAETAI